jgi:hypothetical protein
VHQQGDPSGPDHRGLGVASAMLTAVVADLRARGAGAIGAEPDDTPRHLYAGQGFVPAVVRRSCTRRPQGQDVHDVLHGGRRAGLPRRVEQEGPVAGTRATRTPADPRGRRPGVIG